MGTYLSGMKAYHEFLHAQDKAASCTAHDGEISGYESTACFGAGGAHLYVRC